MSGFWCCASPLLTAGASSGRERIQILLRAPGHQSRPPEGERNSAALSAAAWQLQARSRRLWDFVVSLIHTQPRLLPRRAINFGLVGASSVVVQLLSTAMLMGLLNLTFQQALPVAVITAASSNYLVNNALTFRDRVRADGS